MPRPAPHAPLVPFAGRLLVLAVALAVFGCSSVAPATTAPPTLAPTARITPSTAPTRPPTPTPTAAPTASPTASRRSPSPAPTTTGYSTTWQVVDPGGDTVCARGGRFRFWVRRGDPRRLAFFLQGGGGCWDYASCRPGSSLFDDSVSELDHPARYDGIFDLDRADNPLRDWTFVAIPACGADVFWGNRDVTYRSSSGDAVTIRHHGFANASAALDWATENVPSPERVFVSGCSAGSAGSVLMAPYLLEAYPEASVEQLGDSLAFIFSRTVDMTRYGAEDALPDWIPELRTLDLTAFRTSDYYAAVANHYPDTTFAQVNSRDDSIQRLFYEGLGGSRGQFAADLRASVDAIDAAADNFRSCTLAGGEHCFVDRDRFYARSAGGVALRDWVADLANGEDVPTLR